MEANVIRIAEMLSVDPAILAEEIEEMGANRAIGGHMGHYTTVDAHCGIHQPSGLVCREYREIRTDTAEAGWCDLDDEISLDPDCVQRHLDWMARVHTAECELAELPTPEDCPEWEEAKEEKERCSDWDSYPYFLETMVEIAKKYAA